MLRLAVALLAGLFVTAISGPVRADDNPLLGSWQLTGEWLTNPQLGGRCLNGGMIFTPTMEIILDGQSSIAAEVRYIDARTSQGVIAVIDYNRKSDSPLIKYRVLDRDHLERNDIVRCIYQRAAAQAPLPELTPHVTTYEDALRAIDQMQNLSQPRPLTYDEAMEIIRRGH